MPGNKADVPKEISDTFGDSGDTLEEKLHRRSFFDGRRFLHNEFGDMLIENYFVCKIDGTVHAYQDGVYSAITLPGIMIRELPSITESQRREVRAYLRDAPYTPELELAPPELIPLKSSIYDIETDSTLNYDPGFVFLNKFPWDFDPLAPKSEVVDDLLCAIADGDPDIIELLLEAIGSTLLRVNRYRASFMLYGPSGGNGKSTFLNMLCQFLGPENVSHLSLHDTEQRFRLIGVYGKAANIGDDISDQVLKDSSIYKKLVTGESVVAEYKNVDPVSFRPYAKFFFASNSLPPVSDRSRAFFSRLLVIPLTHDFSKDGDVKLKDRRWTEKDMMYLMRLAIGGLQRVLKFGFHVPDKVKDLVREYETENNPVLGFINEYAKDIEGLSTTEVYADFEVWCQKAGHRRVIAKEKFSRELRNLEGFTTVPRWNGTKHTRVFTRDTQRNTKTTLLCNGKNH